ncbi:MAG: DNA polymerase Y family protein [Bacteroidetes bacterium]|nr:DNA polymerase Y family protein [Bacteroidota bacterium]
MRHRFVSLWFHHLTTDWFSIRRPELRNIPFVLSAPDHGRKIITAANALAEKQGIGIGMTVADARALLPALEVTDDKPGLAEKLLKALAEWCIRFTPVAAIDLPGGILLDASGCAHLWGGEKNYLRDILLRLKNHGYDVRGAMADTTGAAWAIARYGNIMPVVEAGQQAEALLPLPPEALRLEPAIVEKLYSLGLTSIHHLVGMPRPALRRRFGDGLLLRLDQAMGRIMEPIQAVQPAEPWQERLPCLEPIATAAGIEIALRQLLDTLCSRLRKEGKGLRTAHFKGYRIDGKTEQVSIGTSRASHHVEHLYKLLAEGITAIEPGLGIELFVLEAPKVEDAQPIQEKIWGGAGGLEDVKIAELLDRIAGRIGADNIHRYLPDEHHWPERSIKKAVRLDEKPATAWRTDRLRPIRLLATPEPVEVSAPVPDYPPMLFRYKGKLHRVKKADGPERIEREWWMDDGPHRDYYSVEDEEGMRYWLFRSGHYDEENRNQWYLHGFFA